jgi:MFS family permease
VLASRTLVVTPRRILAAAVVAQAGISFAEQGVPTIGVFVKRDLALSATAAGAVVSALGVGRIVGFYAAGIAVDRRGERRVLFVGALGAGTCIAAAAAFHYAGLLAALTVAGLFLATATPAGGKLVFTAFRPERRALAMAIRQAGVPIGGVCAAAVLPGVAGILDWRWSLVVAGAVSALGGLGAVALAGLGPQVEAGARPASRSVGPFLERELLLVTTWASILVVAQYVVLTFFAIDAHGRARLSAGTAATLILVVQAAGIAGRVFWGSLADRFPAFGVRRLFAAVSGVAFASALLLAVLPAHDLLTFVLVGTLAGVSINSWQGLYLWRLTELAGADRAGAAAGFGLTFLAVSFTLAPPAYGAIADAFGTLRATWLALAATLAVGGIVTSFFRVSARTL